MIPGYATSQGTARYCGRFPAAVEHFREVEGLFLSSIGLGTYLGNPDDRTDASYAAAVRRALGLGCNVIDSAINYRCQRSERAIGRALQEAVAAREVARDEVFLSTKGGFVPFDGGPPDDPADYFRRTFVETGIVERGDLVAGCHCMTPRYLRHQLGRSRENLGVETIDLYYIHNPETQLAELPRQAVYQRLREAFATLEDAVERGWIRRYGVASWHAFRSEPDSPPYLSIEELVRLAGEVAGEGHHFRAIQLPVNLGMPEAFAHTNQPVEQERLPALIAARRFRLMAFASASLYQGSLIGELPDWLRKNLGEEASDAQRALQFVRSCPGLTTALVGMCQVVHVEENMALVSVPPFTLEQLERSLRPPS